LSAVPFVVVLVLNPVVALFADWLRSPGRLSTNVVRKIFCVVGFSLGGCFFILIGYADCNAALVVATVCAVMAASCLVFCSVDVNVLDLAPVHAGPIAGLVYTVAIISAIAAPLAACAFTSQQPTRSQWQKVFYLTAGVYAFGAIVYLIFGSGDRQSWADDTTTQDQIRDTFNQNHEQTGR